MVRRAWRAGISKHRIFVLSGIARTTIDRILKSKEELVADIHDDGDTYVPDPDACIDGNGQEHPEHDYPPVAEGNECRRCGAEAGDDEEG